MIFYPNWPWPAPVIFNVILYISRLSEFFQEALYSEFCLEGPSEIVVEFRQLISLQNRPLAGIFNFSCMEYHATWSTEAGKYNFRALNYDLPGKRKHGLSAGFRWWGPGAQAWWEAPQNL